MQFNDNEIWNLPVADAEAEQGSEQTVAPSSAGRLYASAGAPAHPDAIVALPHHTRNFVSVAELPDAAPKAPEAPIINDPVIAEMLAPAPNTATARDSNNGELPDFDWAKSIELPVEPVDQFKDWYADPVIPPVPVKTGLDAQQVRDAAGRARTQLQDMGELMTATRFDVLKYGLITIVGTAVVGIAEALLSGKLGLAFGIALLLTTAFGALKLDRADMWIGWVMPAYVAIAAILVAGQFADSAPGPNVVGQALLVGTTLITIAPWLAVATLIGAIAPRFRKG